MNTSIQLRNHIPLAGAATREPCTGEESSLRVSLGFTPRWYNKRLGIDFSRPWHEDPAYRYESLVKMRSRLSEVFPMIPYFSLEEKDGIYPECATISSVYGILLISMLYGIEPVYMSDNWPDGDPESRPSKETLAALEPFDLERHPVMQNLLKQMDRLEELYGEIRGYLNYQGILNIAMKIRGQELFMDMIDDPDFAHHLFTHIADTIGRTAKIIQARQRCSGFEVNLLSMSNCVMSMISSQMYEEFILPLDQSLSKGFDRFGVHTCNWVADPYLDSLRKIDKMGYLDTGLHSDLPRMREMFPDARRAVLFMPTEIESLPMHELESTVQKVAEEYAPCDLVLADIENTTEDQRIRDFIKLTEKYSQK